MFPLKKILVPTDFSAPAESAVELGAALAKADGAKLLLLHVDPPALSHGEEIDRRLPEYHKRLRDLIDAVPAPIPAERILAEGDPAEVIAATARERGCDLIVIGTHGRTGLERLLVGSVAETVMRKADGPVLTVKAPAKAVVHQ